MKKIIVLLMLVFIDEYESDTGDYQSYQWYSHSDTYEDMDENSISVTFYDGELSDLELMYIGWD